VIKHSILLMTYNQESFIEEAINSCLNQIEKPYEIIILDDGSIDNTWNIIEAKRKSNPQIIKSFKNESNKGIYYTYEKLKSLATGNVFSYLAGDDFLLPECVSSINESINSNKLDPDTNKFIIVTNNYGFYKIGTKVFSNNFKLRNYSPIKLMLRRSLAYRGIGMSKSLHDSVLNTYNLSLSKPGWKYSIDSVKGIDEVTKVEKIIFINCVAAAQRLGVGVTSVSFTHILSEEAIREYISYLKKEYSSYWDNSDLRYLNYLEKNMILISQYNLFNLFNFIIHLIYNVSNFHGNDPFWKQIRFLIPRTWLTKIKRFFV
jgi:glycosyltransferase involved in cell wall biosynthesis